MNQRSTLFLVALAAVVISSSVIAEETPDIYLVQLKHKRGGDLICAGTLVNELYVVSAAHCLAAAHIEDIVVVGGAIYDDERGTKRSIVATATHPLYDTVNKFSSYDICIFKLNQPMLGMGIKPAPLCSQPLNTGEKVQVSGWGRTLDGCASSKQLRTVDVPVMSENECKTQFPKIYREAIDKNAMFCTDVLEEKDSCVGESGGPAIFQNELCGVISWSSGVYTNVFEISSFAKKAMTLMSLNTYDIGGVNIMYA